MKGQATKYILALLVLIHFVAFSCFPVSTIGGSDKGDGVNTVDPTDPSDPSDPTNPTNPSDSVRGTLSYEKDEYSFDQFIGRTKVISPLSLPSVDGMETIYTIEHDGGDDFVTITSSSDLLVDLMFPRQGMYTVRAEIVGYTVQRVPLTITVEPAPGEVSLLEFVPLEDGVDVSWVASEQTGSENAEAESDQDVVIDYNVYYAEASLWQQKPEIEEFIETAVGEGKARLTRQTSISVYNLEGDTRYYMAIVPYNTKVQKRTPIERLTVNVFRTETKSIESIEGVLRYEDTIFRYQEGEGGSLQEIVPVSRPSIVGQNLLYIIEHKEGEEFAFGVVNIDARDGKISINVGTTNIGIGTYTVRVRIEGAAENDQDYQTIDITIEIKPIIITTYSGSRGTTQSPPTIGQGILDVIDNSEVVLTISNLIEDEDYTVIFSGGGIFNRIARNGRIEIKKLDFFNEGVFLERENLELLDGAFFKIKKGNGSLQYIATYNGLEIRGWQDLQSMRIRLYGDYVIMQDIEIPDSYLFEAIGTSATPFTGSLDGRNGDSSYRISGLQIDKGTHDYQGLFGVIESFNEDSVMVSNLLIHNPIITGRSYVGVLAGDVKGGTIHSVSVESDSSSSKIEIRGSQTIAVGAGGGLVGYLQSGAILRNVSAHIPVLGPAKKSVNIGGLVGINKGRIEGGVATGNVTGRYEVGGLVGRNDGFLVGYATGDVSASSSAEGGFAERIGGLVGNAGLYSETIGYSRGTVTGTYIVGGLVGTAYARRNWIKYNSLTGYSRGNLIRLNVTSTHTSFGRVLGYDDVRTNKSYHSTAVSESNIFESDGRTRIESLLTGDHETSVDIVAVTNNNYERIFSLFTFGTGLGEWTWVGNGKWPALNVGDVSPAREQPID